MEKVVLDESKCIGCGACVGIADKNFTFGESSSKLIDDSVTEEAKNAASCCPTGAITIEEK